LDSLSVFNGKKVFVTGDTGFKGSWLCIWLKKLGAEVHGFALPPERKLDNFNICNLSKEINHIDGDIRTADLDRILRDIEPEFIFHLAAQPIVLESFKDPATTYETNIMGTVRLLEAARNLEKLKSIVVVTSDKCYENTGDTLVEGCPLGGDDPYSASKACEDLISSSYYKSFFHERGVGLSTARAGNVIGGGDRAADRIVPDTIFAIENDKDITIRNIRHIRPWQYVLEPLRGYLHLAAAMYGDQAKYSDAWNFGPSEASHVTVVELVEALLTHAQTILDKPRVTIRTKSQINSKKEKGVLKMDSTKSRQRLGVKNILDLNDVYHYVIEDYLHDGDFMQQRLDRIQKYEEKTKDEV